MTILESIKTTVPTDRHWSRLGPMKLWGVAGLKCYHPPDQFNLILRVSEALLCELEAYGFYSTEIAQKTKFFNLKFGLEVGFSDFIFF